MKKAFSLIICLLLCLQLAGTEVFLVDAESTKILYEDDFSYTEFGSVSLYEENGAWEREYATPKNSNDAGSVECTAPTVKNGALVFGRGDGIRLNWQKLSGFSGFDASKTYTVTFDFRVTDFGNDKPQPGYASWNREMYFAVAGYYNQIECRSGNYSGQLGIRAGDKTSEFPLGGWTNNTSLYKEGTVYSCTFEWIPSQKKVISTVATEGKIIAQGSRTDNVYATDNKSTRFLVWRCEDGTMELDNVTFSDGSKTYTQTFDFAGKDSMTGSGVWGLENVQKKDAKEPTFKNGALVLSEHSSVKFDWTKVDGVGSYDNAKTYTFSFDLKLTDKGDGSNWNGEVHTRAIYIAFGGWYNLIELPTKDNTVKLGGTSEAYSDSKYLNKTLRGTVIWEGTELSISLTDASGKVLISGKRSSGDFVNMTAQNAAMTNLVFRCEDGEYQVDNFSFAVEETPVLDQTKIDLSGNKQAEYTCTVNYNGNDKISVKYGGAELFSMSGTILSVAGKTVPGSYKAGRYTVNSYISPAQEMVTVEVIDPEGSVVRRGFYTLLGGEEICIYGKDESAVLSAEVKYSDAEINDYTYTTTEPVYTGVGAKIYNIVTSFDNAQTTRNFAWTVKAAYQSNQPMELQYREAGKTEWITVAAVQENEPVNTPDENYFKCDLTGLKADTKYEYKIGIKGSADKWTEIFTFSTAPNEIDSFSFIAVGDTQGITWNGTTSGNKGFMYAMTAYQEAFEELSDPAFMVHVGDVVENGNNQGMWNMYFKTLENKGASVPMFAAIGNHDTWGAPLYFDLHFNHPNNGGTAALDQSYLARVTDGNVRRLFQYADETIYSYDYGDAHFVVLNTGSYTGDDQYIINAQRDWLTADLEASKDAKWTILMFHEPVYHRMGGGESRSWLADVIEGYGVDLVIQGHSHLVTRTYPMKDGKIVTKENLDVIIKGTGTVYTTIGSTALNHDGAGDSTYEEEMAVLLTPTPTQSAYTIVTVEDGQLVVTTKQIDGFVLDRFVISDEDTDTPDTPDDPDTPDESDTPSEEISADASETVTESAEESETASDSKPSAQTSAGESSVGESSADTASHGGMGWILWAVLGALAVVAGAVLVLPRRKKTA